MSVYLVTWDLNKEGAAYNQARTRLLSGINRYNDVNYTSSLDSVRFISTGSTAQQIYDYLTESYMDSNDVIMIVKLEYRSNNSSQGNLGKDLWEWINARI